MIMAFRGVGKSWITGAFVTWLLRRDAQLNILVVSASKERSDQFTIFTMKLLAEITFLQDMYPQPDQRASMVSFDVNGAEPDHAPSVKAVGILGQMAGSRADVIVADDIEVPNNSETQPMRAKIAERVKEFDAILKPGGRVIYLGTPQTEDTIYKKLPERGYEVRVWPARLPTKAELHYYGDTLAPSIYQRVTTGEKPGTPVDPGRFDDADLVERERSYGRSSFALQFMLSPRLSDSDRYPLRLSDLMVINMDPDLGPEKMIYGRDKDTVIEGVTCVGMDGDYYHAPMDYGRDERGNIIRHKYQGRVLHIDPSGKGKDETSAVVTLMLNGYIFVAEVAAWRDGYGDETLIGLCELAKRWGANRVMIEDNFGGGMFGELLKPHLHRIYPCTIEGVTSSKQKEARIIDTLEPVMNQHRLIVNRSVVEWDYKSTLKLPPEKQQLYRLFYQLTRMQRMRGALSHDDRLDVLAQAVAYWIAHMAADADNNMRRHADKITDGVLKDFMKRSRKQNPHLCQGEGPRGMFKINSRNL